MWRTSFSSIFMIVLVVSLIFFAVFNKKRQEEASLVTPTPEVLEKCGFENCHGLELSCGVEVPDFCTEEYRLGDFCRKLVKCEMIEGNCERVQATEFEDCRDCVSSCELISDPVEAFSCESDCRYSLGQ